MKKINDWMQTVEGSTAFGAVFVLGIFGTFITICTTFGCAPVGSPRAANPRLTNTTIDKPWESAWRNNTDPQAKNAKNDTTDDSEIIKIISVDNTISTDYVRVSGRYDWTYDLKRIIIAEKSDKTRIIGLQVWQQDDTEHTERIPLEGEYWKTRILIGRVILSSGLSPGVNSSNRTVHCFYMLHQVDSPEDFTKLAELYAEGPILAKVLAVNYITAENTLMAVASCELETGERILADVIIGETVPLVNDWYEVTITDSEMIKFRLLKLTTDPDLPVVENIPVDTLVP